MKKDTKTSLIIYLGFAIFTIVILAAWTNLIVKTCSQDAAQQLSQNKEPRCEMWGSKKLYNLYK